MMIYIVCHPLLSPPLPPHLFPPEQHPKGRELDEGMVLAARVCHGWRLLLATSLPVYPEPPADVLPGLCGEPALCSLLTAFITQGFPTCRASYPGGRIFSVISRDPG